MCVIVVWEDLACPLARSVLRQVADLSFLIDSVGMMTLVWTSVVLAAQHLFPWGMVLHHLVLEKLPITRHTFLATGVFMELRLGQWQ